VLDVGGNGALGHDQLRGNLAIRQPVREQCCHLLLAWTQFRDSFARFN
jgi:hypothetical protein